MLLWNHYPHFVLSIVEVNDKTKHTNYEDVLNNLFNLIYINVEIVDRKSAVHTITQDVSQILVSPKICSAQSHKMLAKEFHPTSAVHNHTRC
jgi:hypothetical protein